MTSSWLLWHWQNWWCYRHKQNTQYRVYIYTLCNCLTRYMQQMERKCHFVKKMSSLAATKFIILTNFRCSKWGKIRHNDNISVSVNHVCLVAVMVWILTKDETQIRGSDDRTLLNMALEMANSFHPGRNDHHIADDIFKYIFINEKKLYYYLNFPEVCS